MTCLYCKNGKGYMALKYHLEDAYNESNITIPNNICTTSPPYAIFSYKYYNDIKSLNHVKKYDYCFIGSIKSDLYNRQWIIDFAKQYFTENSIFVNTDYDDWVSLGSFDLSYKKLGYSPKFDPLGDGQSRRAQFRIVQENLFYFETLCQSKFVLCPAGDSPWSFRFYEVLMCESMPIVKKSDHTWRMENEKEINYKYILSDNVMTYNELLYNMDIQENTEKFKSFHLLPFNKLKHLSIRNIRILNKKRCNIKQKNI